MPVRRSCTYMSSRCNPTGIGWEEYKKNDEACHKVSKWIVDNLEKSIELRHRIGSEILSGSNADSAAQSKKDLAAAIAPVRDTYEQARGRCEKEDDGASCIMAEKYADLLRFFGPIDAISRNIAKPTALGIARLQSGYVVTATGKGGPQYEVLLDTAANVTVLSHHLAEMFKEHIRLITDSSNYGNTVPTVSVSKLAFDMGGVQFEPSIALVSPIVDFLEGSDEDKRLIAILGADFLFGRPWEVNYDASQLIIDQDVKKRLAGGGWEQIPLSIHPYYMSYYLGARVYIDGRPYTLAFDTGASGIDLSERCFSPSDGQRVTGGITESMEGRSMSTRVRDARLRIGSREVNITYDVTPGKSVNADSLLEAGFCGVLGTDVFRNFNYIYDPETMSLYLRPRQRVADITEARGIGFVPNRMRTGDGRAAFEVVDVVPGSGAEKAGIRKGDIVVKMADASPDKISILEFLDMFYSKDPNLPVKVIRNGEVLEIIIKRD